MMIKRYLSLDIKELLNDIDVFYNDTTKDYCCRDEEDEENFARKFYFEPNFILFHPKQRKYRKHSDDVSLT